MMHKQTARRTQAKNNQKSTAAACDPETPDQHATSNGSQLQQQGPAELTARAEDRRASNNQWAADE
eukprot:10188298-Alexandrium_andersonii.AAC.1